jgi:hypothetical protein
MPDRFSDQPQSEPKPKIIVDDDWKSRVQAEKEALKKQAESPSAASPVGESQAGPTPAAKRSEEAGASSDADVLPPASFPLLVTTIATQAMASLGQIPDPIDNQPRLQLDLAKHYIDTLDVLEAKTKGNLTHEEAAMLENVLHDLRMLYISIKKHSQQAAAKGPRS